MVSLRTIRVNFFVVTVALVCIGIVMIYSASSIYAWDHYKDAFYFLKRHMAAVVMGLFVMFAVMTFDYARLRHLAKPLLLISFFLLVLLLIPHLSREISGARRWFRFGFVSFQPSELFNMVMIIYTADFIARKHMQLRSVWWAFIPLVAVLGAGVLLILMQPDLGTALAIATVTMIMLFVSGVKSSYLLGMILTCLPVLAVLILSVPYRRMRILAFLNPWADPTGIGFQIIQSQIALGSGGIFGLGLGHSKQKLFYLPAAHTDFIFSIIGEELGLVGTLGVIVMFIVFILLALKIIKYSRDRFGYFLGVGLLSLISFKTIVNIGVSCGLLPTKGLPLPFISYGGSSFIIDMLSVGLLLNISRRGENTEG